jgi:hypothetical protein
VLLQARELVGHTGGIDTTTGAPVVVKNPQTGATITTGMSSSTPLRMTLSLLAGTPRSRRASRKHSVTSTMWSAAR